MLDTFPERFKYAIEVIMLRTKKNKKTIAESLNISPPALTQLMNGKTKSASLPTLKQLEKQYFVSTDWLKDGESDSLAEMFLIDDGFSSLRQDSKVIITYFGEKTFVATLKGWEKILDFKSNSQGVGKTLNKTLLKKINAWEGVAGSMRKLKATPFFLENYASENDPGTVYEHIIFYLEGTRPKGYILAEKVNSLPCDDQNEYKNRVILRCINIYGSSWSPIKLNLSQYEYYIDLSENEYLTIINKQLPSPFHGDARNS